MSSSLKNTDSNEVEACLILIRGTPQGHRFFLKLPEIIIGSDSATDICIEGQNLSSKHAKISKRNDGIFLADLGSQSGTYVNGARVNTGGEIELKKEDMVKCGDSICKYLPAGEIEIKFYGNLIKAAEKSVADAVDAEKYRALQVENETPLLVELRAGENSVREFKSTLRTNLHTMKVESEVHHGILKTVCAFLNSKEGGTLFIGVDDAGSVIGIEVDNFENNDKFGLHLQNILRDKIGTIESSNVRVTFHLISQKTVVRLECKPSVRPVFLKGPKEEEFYVRTGPRTEKLKISEVLEYCKIRFS